MARPNKIWFRKQTGWWMVQVGTKQVKLAQGRENKKAAQEKFHKLMAIKAEAPESPTARVADVIEKFLKWASLHLSPETNHNYRFYGQKLAERWGYLPVADFKPFHVTDWCDANAWGDTTEYNARRSAFRVFSWAMQEGILTGNPLKGMSRPKPKPRDRALTDDEYRSMLRASRIYFRRLLFALRQTGARPKELRTLRWTQVREDRLVLREHKTVKKTKKDRVIWLTPPMRKLLAVLRRDSTCEYVFLNSRGKPWTMNAVRLQVMRLKKKLGLQDDVCAYLVRHQWGTAAILNGTNPSVVAELMGNSLEMISTVYVHLAEQHTHLREEMEKATRPPGSSTPRPAVRNPAG